VLLMILAQENGVQREKHHHAVRVKVAADEAELSPTHDSKWLWGEKRNPWMIH
jgi:hypothetical protein